MRDDGITLYKKESRDKFPINLLENAKSHLIAVKWKLNKIKWIENMHCMIEFSPYHNLLSTIWIATNIIHSIVPPLPKFIFKITILGNYIIH